MDRVIVYPGQVPLETDLLNLSKNTMMGLGYLAQATVGVGPVIQGLGVSSTTSPGLSVFINAGSMYIQQIIDQTAYSSIAADTTGIVVKQGINDRTITLGPVTLPTGSNKQICVVQAKLVESDTDAVVLPYYNSANPNVALNGSGGNGVAQPRTRKVGLQFNFLYGTPTTGTPAAPSLDPGGMALAQFELRSGTTQINFGIQSATLAAIKLYAGYSNDPRVYPPYASLSSANVFAATQVFQSNVVVSGALSSPTPGAGVNGFPILSQFLDNAASSGSVKIPMPDGSYIYIKWGGATANNGTAAFGVSFSPAFPNNAWALAVSPSVASTTPPTAWWDSLTVNGFNLRASSVVACRYIAIGD